MIPMPTNPMSSDYAVKFTLWNNQRTQDAQNKTVHDAYLGAQSHYLQVQELQEDKNLPLDPNVLLPSLPVQIIYNDDGSVTYLPFPDLTPTVLPPVGQKQQGGLVTLGPIPEDRTDKILTNQTIMLVLLNEILSKFPQ